MPSKFCWPLMSRPFPFCGVAAFETSSCFPTQPLIFYVTVSFTLRPTPTIHIITQSLTRNKQKPKATKKEARSRRPCFFLRLNFLKTLHHPLFIYFLRKNQTSAISRRRRIVDLVAAAAGVLYSQIAPISVILKTGR